MALHGLKMDYRFTEYGDHPDEAEVVNFYRHVVDNVYYRESASRKEPISVASWISGGCSADSQITFSLRDLIIGAAVYVTNPVHEWKKDKYPKPTGGNFSGLTFFREIFKLARDVSAHDHEHLDLEAFLNASENPLVEALSLKNRITALSNES